MAAAIRKIIISLIFVFLFISEFTVYALTIPDNAWLECDNPVIEDKTPTDIDLHSKVTVNQDGGPLPTLSSLGPKPIQVGGFDISQVVNITGDNVGDHLGWSVSSAVCRPSVGR